jgi:Lon-like ATP-dependent protease
MSRKRSYDFSINEEDNKEDDTKVDNKVETIVETKPTSRKKIKEKTENIQIKVEESITNDSIDDSIKIGSKYTTRKTKEDKLPEESISTKITSNKKKHVDIDEETISTEEEDDEDDESYVSSSAMFDIDKELKTMVKQGKLNPEVHSSLTKVKDEIARTEPSVQNLLLTPMRLEDRAKLCQYYEIYRSQLPNTNEWLESRNRYNDMFKEYTVGYQQARKYSEEELVRMKTEEEKFTGFDAQLSLKYKILNLETSQENKQVIYRRYEEFLSLSTLDDEYGKLKNWLTWATDYPHDKKRVTKIDNITEFIKYAKKKLDDELYGMANVKEQILIYLTAKLKNPSMIHSNLALLGEPGVGKTKIARLLAEIMDCGFSQISFGGVDKADFLKGHEYTYIGSQPGEMVKCMKRMGHKNGVVFFDEFDKIAENSEIRSALLHMVDPSQNCDYHDNFLGAELKLDLSHIWYVASMNSIPKDEALADRWWIIHVEGYTNKDKVEILENYILPKALKNCGMTSESIVFYPGTATYLINKICIPSDKGVRTLEKFCKDIVNKVNFLLTHQDEEGKVPFKISFQFDYKLTAPITLTNKFLDSIIESQDLKSMINSMYI